MDDSLLDDLVMYGDDFDVLLSQENELLGVEVVLILLYVLEYVIMVL